MSVTATKTNKALNSRWGLISQPEKTFTADNMIEAYERGLVDGKNQYPEKIKEILQKNLGKTLPTVEHFYNKIKDNAGKFMMLQIAGIDYFKVIVALDEDVFFDDSKCESIYRNSFNVAKELENINISFIPYSGEGSVNIESLIADNYLFIYGREKQ